MFLRFNQILFGALLYAAQSGILISILFLVSSGFLGLIISGDTAKIDLASAASMIMGVGGTIFMVCFLATFLSFSLFMIFRSFKKQGNEKIEAWIVPSAAALMVLSVMLINSQGDLRWEPVAFLLALSVGAVLVSRRVYLRVWAKLVVL